MTAASWQARVAAFVTRRRVKPALAVRVTPEQALHVDLLGSSRSVAVLPGPGRPGESGYWPCGRASSGIPAAARV